MPNYIVFQQRAAHGYKGGSGMLEWHLNLVKVGEVEAYSGSHAIDKAKAELIVFRSAPRSSLTAYPVVQEVK